MKEQALIFHDPNSILLSKSVAEALFGKTDAVGKVVKLDNDQPLTVTGVFEDLPNNSSFSDVNFFCPWSLLLSTNKGVKDNMDNWGNSSVHIFTEAANGVSMEKISALSKMFIGIILKINRRKQQVTALTFFFIR